MPFFKSKEDQGPQVDFDHLPRHIAIIMDGNGRWAKRRGLPRTAGHAAGAETFRRVATYCKEIGLDYLTVYAFSTENWKRSSSCLAVISSRLSSLAKNMSMRCCLFSMPMHSMASFTMLMVEKLRLPRAMLDRKSTRLNSSH